MVCSCLFKDAMLSNSVTNSIVELLMEHRQVITLMSGLTQMTLLEFLNFTTNVFSCQ